MWMISLRDLQFRHRRFSIAVLATSLVFAMTLLMAGVSASLHNEIRRITDVIGADSWVVAHGTLGPFTGATVVRADTAEAIAASAGVEAADPLVILRSAMQEPVDLDVNIIGYRIGGLGSPPVTEGRTPRGPGEAVVDSFLGVGVGERMSVGGRTLEVTGVADGITFYFGTPTMFVSLEDAQRIGFSGKPLASTIIAKGRPTSLPEGLDVLDSGQVRADLERPLASGSQSIDFISALLWLTAAGIVGSIIYVSALDRTRDFAVLKATGAPNRTLMMDLALQAIVLSVASAILAIGLTQLLGPTFPFAVEISSSSYVSLFGIAISVGLLASIAGLRRAVGVDPALAFGGA
ncbi:MAG: glutamine ABC transporter permease [Actinobacteria bacterium]|nr:glutamine ABC transporter permease [Actinomycetota bacterium]